jgi:hypothetical protein
MNRRHPGYYLNMGQDGRGNLKNWRLVVFDPSDWQISDAMLGLFDNHNRSFVQGRS